MPNSGNWFTAYLGLGSNIGDGESQLLSAIEALNKYERITLLNQSSLYLSKPVDNSKQNNYSNAAISIHTNHTPLELLKICQAVEQQHNKIKQYHWGPRTLDIDILSYGQVQMTTKDLTLPHPQIIHRDFVITPLLEINPLISIAGLGVIAKLPPPKKNIINISKMKY